MRIYNVAGPYRSIGRNSQDRTDVENYHCYNETEHQLFEKENKSDTSISDVTLEELLEWVEENTDGAVELESYNAKHQDHNEEFGYHGHFVEFEDDNDAFLFETTWAGRIWYERQEDLKDV